MVDTELFTRLNNHVLDQIIHDQQSRSSRECATTCDITNGCKAFNFTKTEQRCLLANGIIAVDTSDGIVYARESVVSKYIAITIYLVIK